MDVYIQSGSTRNDVEADEDEEEDEKAKKEEKEKEEGVGDDDGGLTLPIQLTSFIPLAATALASLPSGPRFVLAG